MAEKYDVAARLAEGLPAVENIQSYVWACHLLGYQFAELTRTSGQVLDEYAHENGLDLRSLDEDCAALRVATAATDAAVTLEDDQRGILADAWSGAGADHADAFQQRHTGSARTAAAAVRHAAEVLADLRENLWQAVDAKVAAVQAIENRTQSQRQTWLAAARIVTGGGGDRAAASELIDHHVKPYVDNDIRLDWLAVIAATTETVTAAYAAAAAQLRSHTSALFEVPGDLGPVWSGPVWPGPAGARAGESVPAAGHHDPAVDYGAVDYGAADYGAPVPARYLPAQTAPMDAPVGSSSGWAGADTPGSIDALGLPGATAPSVTPSATPFGDLGGALPGGLGGGFGGLGQQLADLVGGLLPSDSVDGFSGPDDLAAGPGDDGEPGDEDDPNEDDPDEDDPNEDDPDEDDPNKDDPDEDDPEKPGDADAGDEHPGEPEIEPEQAPGADGPAGPAGGPEQTPPGNSPPQGEPAVIPQPDPVPGAPVADDGQTPCEIAAGELPQAGQ